MSVHSEGDAGSAQYYDDHATAFVEQTLHLDMESIYSPFLASIPNAGRILDAGCGSGRDAKAFLERGYDVFAFDASEKMCELASRVTGLKVRRLTFGGVDFKDQFDGIWACASLLHVARCELDDAVARLVCALRVGGVLYVSFKEGLGDRVLEGRRFTDFTIQSLRGFLSNHPALEIGRIWTTNDSRPGREREQWVNAIARKRDRNASIGAASASRHADVGQA